MAEQDIHQILNRALGADEAGNKEAAIEFYLEAVEAILKITDPSVKAKLNRFATQSLDRAETLKGVRRPEPEVVHPPSNVGFRSVLPVKSNYIFVLLLCS